MACCGYNHKVGNKGKVVYNARTRRLWPSDLRFTMVTNSLIHVPTTLCYLYAIIWAETMSTALKVVVLIIYTFSIYGSCRNLYKCSFTEPGIIPTIEKPN